MMPAAFLLLLAALAFAQVSVVQVQVDGQTYIAVRIDAVQQYGANFTSFAYANSSGVYVAVNPPTQQISCRWNNMWYNGTGLVRIPDPSASPVCWFRGFPYPVAVAPMKREILPFPLMQYTWLINIVPIGLAMFWRRIEVAGIMTIILAILNAWAYPLFGFNETQAIAVSLIMIAAGIILILASRAGE